MRTIVLHAGSRETTQVRKGALLATGAFKRKARDLSKPRSFKGPLLALVAAITPLNLTLICGAIFTPLSSPNFVDGILVTVDAAIVSN